MPVRRHAGLAGEDGARALLCATRQQKWEPSGSNVAFSPFVVFYRFYLDNRRGTVRAVSGHGDVRSAQSGAHKSSERERMEPARKQCETFAAPAHTC